MSKPKVLPPLNIYWVLVRNKKWLIFNFHYWTYIDFWLENENWVWHQKPNIRSISSSIPLDRCDLIIIFLTLNVFFEGVISYIFIIFNSPWDPLIVWMKMFYPLYDLYLILSFFFCCFCYLKKQPIREWMWNEQQCWKVWAV